VYLSGAQLLCPCVDRIHWHDFTHFVYEQRDAGKGNTPGHQLITVKPICMLVPLLALVFVVIAVVVYLVMQSSRKTKDTGNR